MKRRLFLALMATSPVFAVSFDDFKKKNSREFRKFQEELLQEFNEYVAMIDKEFAEYKQSLSKTWDIPLISSNHTWVQYSSDYNTRSIVNFSDNSLKIETLGGKGLNKDEHIRHHFNHILQQDTKAAVNNDQLIMNIESHLKDYKHVKGGNIPDSESILGLAFLAANSPVDDEYIDIEEPTYFAENNSVYQSFPGEIQVVSKSSESVLSSGRRGVETQQVNGLSSDNVVIKLSSKFLTRRAKKQTPIVLSNSDKYQVNFAALMALMHTESSFNPMALSDSAYGLLMINPETSGKQAHKKIYGVDKIISPSFLYNNVNNIELGSAYFNLLYHQYLKEITSPVSRLYCAIVSYNAGLGNVARVFIGKPVLKKSFDAINKMSPDSVFKTFQDELPFEESKIYLTKVKDRLSFYIN